MYHFTVISPILWLVYSRFHFFCSEFYWSFFSAYISDHYIQSSKMICSCSEILYFYYILQFSFWDFWVENFKFCSYLHYNSIWIKFAVNPFLGEFECAYLGSYDRPLFRIKRIISIFNMPDIAFISFRHDVFLANIVKQPLSNLDISQLSLEQHS